MNKELLGKVADTIEATGRFDIAFLAWDENRGEEISCAQLNECGTVGCVAGWTLHLAGVNGSMYHAGHLLGLNTRQSDRLFVAGPGSVWNDVAEKEQWPELIDKYLPWCAVTAERAVRVIRGIVKGELVL